MKILLVYPQYPDTFWSFKHALKFISKRAAFPPLGLLTVASMLPGDWQKKVVDMNIDALRDSDLKWADYVFLSAMAVQKESAQVVIKRCNKLGVKIVAGGPLFTSEYQQFASVDFFVLNEAEITLPLFLQDLRDGCVKHIYSSQEWPQLQSTPMPSWNLINIKKYNCLSVQYSRGCPFNCEFCDIVVLNGRIPRTKSKNQLIAELDILREKGWRSTVFIVDDNFIGNKNKLKSDILPAIIGWMREHKYPFSLFTEASMNLADDDELIQLMVAANFKTVFIGIETPNPASLSECGKYQNENRDLIASVRKLQKCGLIVQGGFIVGFDNDPHSIFENQIRFIQKTGIVTAMVGLLHAPPGTRLYDRLKNEKRLVKEFSGDNSDCSMNFVPKMDGDALMKGYLEVIKTIYSPKQYCERIKIFLRDYEPMNLKRPKVKLIEIVAFFKSIWALGIKARGQRYYWQLLAWTLIKKPRHFPLTITLSIYGFHFRKITKKYIKMSLLDNA